MDRRVYDKYVLEVIRQGSLTRAADTLGISQPALSSGISALEKDVGIRIFNRKTVPVSLTPEGTLYYDYIQRIKTLTVDFQKRVRAIGEEADHRAVIGGPVVYAESIIADAVVRLRKEQPEYSVTIKCSPLSELIEMASTGEISCFISTSEHIPAQFVKKMIKREKLYLCVPRAFRVNDVIREHAIRSGGTGQTLDYSVLDGESFIFLEEKLPLQQQVNGFLRQYGVRPRSFITVNQVSTALNLALRGEGICFASEEALEGKLDPEALCVYGLPDSISGRRIYVAYDGELMMTRACGELIRLLTEAKDDQ